MKIFIILEDSPLGGVEIKVMRMGEPGNDDLSADTPANAMAQDLEARLQTVISAAAKVVAQEREPSRCLH